jgi:site-specific DNA-methyltransferase (adenine-specific)
MQTNIIHNEDCVEGMLALPAGSVDVVVTSPPYNLNINYGIYKDDLPRNNYLSWLHDVFSAVKHCLKDDGHFFLNMGYSNVDPWVGIDVGNVARNLFVLQNNFTWVKSIYVDGKTSGHFKPINSDRFANPTWEHLFHFTKKGDVKCDKLAAGVPYEWDCNTDNSGRIRGRLVKKMGFDNYKHFEKTASNEQKQEMQTKLDEKLANAKPKPTMRCRGNTWYVPYDTIANREKQRGSHPATFPVALAEQCILFSGVKNGVVLDPFMGSGTTAIGALRQGCKYVGFDIDPEYIQFANDRISAENDLFSELFLES